MPRVDGHMRVAVTKRDRRAESCDAPRGPDSLAWVPGTIPSTVAPFEGIANAERGSRSTSRGKGLYSASTRLPAALQISRGGAKLAP